MKAVRSAGAAQRLHGFEPDADFLRHVGELADGFVEGSAPRLEPAKLALRLFQHHSELPRVRPLGIIEIHHLLDFAQRESDPPSEKDQLQPCPVAA